MQKSDIMTKTEGWKKSDMATCVGIFGQRKIPAGEIGEPFPAILTGQFLSRSRAVDPLEKVHFLIKRKCSHTKIV